MKVWPRQKESFGSMSNRKSTEWMTVDEHNEIVANLVREIEVLRLYGNKDCTAMADERLAEEEHDEIMEEITKGGLDYV